MTYPKPLSVKTIERMYRESGLTQEQREFLSGLFEGASFLYGVIQLKDLWSVYRELTGKIDAVKLQRKDIYAFSSIARREEHSYRIYEIDEFYTEEKRSDGERFLVLNEIVDDTGRDVFYHLVEEQDGKPFYVPENLLSIKGHIISEEEKMLRKYLDNLVSTSDTIAPLPGNSGIREPSPYKGKKLSSFIHLSKYDKFEIQWLSGEVNCGRKTRSEKELEAYRKKVEVPYSERIMVDLRMEAFTGWLVAQEMIKIFLDKLTEVGVEMSVVEANHLMSLVSDFINSSRLYANRGWTPKELFELQRKSNPGPMRMSFGPGMIQAMKEGNISIDELRKQCRAMGLNVEFEDVKL